ncbi:MAG: phage baseplate assembly protein, partial [Rhodospirillales bacterium]|nr:phage baseplate assembly protein [Rhodospirillales bacterium]
MSFQGRNNPLARWADIQRMLQPLRNRIMSTAARAWVRLIYPGKGLQELQVEVLEGELKDQIEHFQPYGFTSAPLENMDALVHFLGGDRAHGIVSVVADRTTRPRTLGQGDVAIYHHTDSAQESAENATHRITLTVGRLVIRVAELDIK